MYVSPECEVLMRSPHELNKTENSQKKKKSEFIEPHRISICHIFIYIYFLQLNNWLYIVFLAWVGNRDIIAVVTHLLREMYSMEIQSRNNVSFCSQY